MTQRTDDGRGPYTYCERGDSHCLDQNCPCVQNLWYRAAYLRARGVRDPVHYLILLLTSPGVWLAVILLAVWYCFYFD